MVPQELSDAPWWIDTALMFVMMASAGVHYFAIAREGHSVGRWLLAIGWTWLSMRFAFALVLTGNIVVNPAAIPAFLMLATGTVFVAWRSLRLNGAPPVYCLQEPDKLCQREDRIRAAIEDSYRESVIHLTHPPKKPRGDPDLH